MGRPHLQSPAKLSINSIDAPIWKNYRNAPCRLNHLLGEWHMLPGNSYIYIYIWITSFGLDISLCKERWLNITYAIQFGNNNYQMWFLDLFRTFLCNFFFGSWSSFIVDVKIFIILTRSQPRYDADMLLWLDVLHANLMEIWYFGCPKFRFRTHCKFF
jgi:hypothetical protein